MFSTHPGERVTRAKRHALSEPKLILHLAYGQFKHPIGCAWLDRYCFKNNIDLISGSININAAGCDKHHDKIKGTQGRITNMRERAQTNITLLKVRESRAALRREGALYSGRWECVLYSGKTT